MFYLKVFILNILNYTSQDLKCLAYVKSIKMHITYLNQHENIPNKYCYSSGFFSSLLIYKCISFLQNTAAGNERKISSDHFYIIFHHLFIGFSELSFEGVPFFKKRFLFRSIHISIIHTAVSSSSPQGGLTPHPQLWLTTVIKPYNNNKTTKERVGMRLASTIC